MTPFGKAVSRSALGIAMAAGLAAGFSAPATAQRQPKAESVSPGFGKVAAPFQKAVADAKTRPNVVAAKGNPAALSAALAPEKAQFEAMMAAAATPVDKYNAGALALGLGQLAEDPAILRRGLTIMIESGKTPPADLPRLNFFLGQTAFQAKDYAAAQTALQAAVSGGYRDNDADALLAQAYISDNKAQQGLTILRQAMDAKRAAGVVPPQNWYRAGLGAAYRGKLLDQAAFFSIGLAQHYPTKENWAGAITVVRDIAKYPAQENLDLLRLMGRTNSFMEERDYIEYIQAADARRFPGEVLSVINTGTTAGKLRAADPFITEARTIANGRVAADRASLPTLERDARAPNASAATVTAAADTFLSYGQAAKAAELYTIAQTKPGADLPRVLTRLGIAQVDSGNYAGAQATFAKVTGPRKSMADLWAIYAQQKAAGKA